MTNTKLSSSAVRKNGPFAFQVNNTTREYEYPWAYEQVIRTGRNLTVVDIGGGVSGLQYVLAAEGYTVINVDPGLKAEGVGFELDSQFHAQVGKDLNAPVRLIAEPLQSANLEVESADIIMSISALEHFSAGDLLAVAREMHRVLKPGGVAILTIDLFLDVFPFSDRIVNRWGHNIDVKEFLDNAGLRLDIGNPNELSGFDTFTTSTVLRNLSDHHVGVHYPCLAQCLVARKLV